MSNEPEGLESPQEEASTDDVDPELVAQLQAASSETHEKIVSLLRERGVTVTALLTAACAVEENERPLALYRALFEVRPEVPVAVDEPSGYERNDYVSCRSNAAITALHLGNPQLAERLLAPVRTLVPEYP
jgi:hypothetical protein